MEDLKQSKRAKPMGLHPSFQYWHHMMKAAYISKSLVGVGKTLENNQHSSIRHIQNSAAIHQGFVYNHSHARHANMLLSNLPSSMDELFSPQIMEERGWHTPLRYSLPARTVHTG